MSKLMYNVSLKKVIFAMEGVEGGARQKCKMVVMGARH